MNAEQWKMIVAAAAFIGFMLGRISGRRGASGSGSPSPAPGRPPEEAFAALSPETQADIDRLLREKKLINAIKEIRKASGLGLKESKDVADWRRKAIGL
ncbi:MAG: hypothetical protein R3C60_06055 [Parvularculaceae bacterium]